MRKKAGGDGSQSLMVMAREGQGEGDENDDVTGAGYWGKQIREGEPRGGVRGVAVGDEEGWELEDARPSEATPQVRRTIKGLLLPKLFATRALAVLIVFLLLFCLTYYLLHFPTYLLLLIHALLCVVV